MNVDVVTEIVIDRPRERVAEYAADPDNAVEWYANIDSVEWRSTPPAEVGSDIAFTARFLGKHVSWFARLATSCSPDRLLDRVAPVLSAPELAVEGLHVFTFNQVAETERWRSGR